VLEPGKPLRRVTPPSPFPAQLRSVPRESVDRPGASPWPRGSSQRRDSFQFVAFVGGCELELIGTAAWFCSTRASPYAVSAAGARALLRVPPFAAPTSASFTGWHPTSPGSLPETPSFPQATFSFKTRAPSGAPMDVIARPGVTRPRAGHRVARDFALSHRHVYRAPITRCSPRQWLPAQEEVPDDDESRWSSC
jgi:hypothetical protein